MQSIPKELGLKPVAMPIYPVMGSLQDVIDLAESKLPIENNNEMVSLFMTYHNTLLNLLEIK